MFYKIFFIVYLIKCKKVILMVLILKGEYWNWFGLEYIYVVEVL